MRAAEIGTECIHVVEGAVDGNFPIGGALADGDGAVMTAETETAGFSEYRLRASLLLVRGAGLGSVGLAGKSLIPERSVAADAAVRCVAERAAKAALDGDGRAAGDGHIVHSEGVGLNRRRSLRLRIRKKQRREKQAEDGEDAVHGFLSAAGEAP